MVPSQPIDPAHAEGKAKTLLDAVQGRHQGDPRHDARDGDASEPWAGEARRFARAVVETPPRARTRCMELQGAA
jgi:hypothetical protein